MKTRLLAVFTLLVGAVSLAPTAGLAAPQDSKPDAKAPAAATQDVVYMSDGRILHGQIVSQTKDALVFEYHDRKINIKTKLTLQRDNILKIEEDVALEAPLTIGGESDASATELPDAPKGAKKSKEEYARTYGASRVFDDSADVPSIYIVPVRGQMGTDIRSDVYKPVIEDIRAQKPDLVVLEVECSDTVADLMLPQGYERMTEEQWQEERQKEWGMIDFDDYRDLVSQFREQLKDYRQVVWVKDADGVAALVAMSWPEIYMTPKARLGAQYSVLDRVGATGWQDPDVRAKMMAAWLSIARAFLEKGGYSPDLAGAMLDSRPKLSGHWVGRKMVWSSDENDEYLVDDSDRLTAHFAAKAAEDFCISQGTAEDADELALLLGMREYKLLQGRQLELTTDYVLAWRRLYEQSKGWMEDFQKYMGWASGAERLQYLTKCKTILERVLSAMKRYEAVKIRWEADAGLTELALITQIEQLEEEIQALRKRDAAGGGRSGGGRMGRGGGGVVTP